MPKRKRAKAKARREAAALAWEVRKAAILGGFNTAAKRVYADVRLPYFEAALIYGGPIK